MTDQECGDGFEYVSAPRARLREWLHAMTPAEFEHFVADLWERAGWDETRVVGASGDFGVDVIATDAERDTRAVIRTRRYRPDTTVDSPEIQQYVPLGTSEKTPDQMLFVTTGEFSTRAEERAPDLAVTLVDGEDLLDLVLELDAEDLVAEYCEDVESRTTADDEEQARADGGLLQWLRRLLGGGER